MNPCFSLKKAEEISYDSISRESRKFDIKATRYHFLSENIVEFQRA